MGMDPEKARALLAASTVPQPELSNAIAGVAQRSEQALYKGEVAGSSPAACTNRESTDVEKLNKLERRFLEYLRSRPHMWIGVQCVTFKLADDTRYTPDIMWYSAGSTVAYEVKGFMRDDARVKLRVAARMYPWIWFKLVTWDKQFKAWSIKDVRP